MALDPVPLTIPDPLTKSGVKAAVARTACALQWPLFVTEGVASAGATDGTLFMHA